MILPLSQVFAADINVDATCSLDQAIKSANAGETRDPNTDYGDCETGDAPDSNDDTKDGSDTITLSGDVTLSRTPSRIQSIITIEGGNFTISGNDRVRVLHVGRSGNLTINNVTIEDGSVNGSNDAEIGGGILNQAFLTINNSTIRDNVANHGGGVGNISEKSGSITLRINNSSITGNEARWLGSSNYGFGDGGGIYLGDEDKSSVVQIRNSIISDNKATDNGGGIVNDKHNLTIENSIISGNQAWDWGGGLWVVPHADTKTFIRNSTITGNKATGESNGRGIGGGIAAQFYMELTHVTIVNNTAKDKGGGVHLSIQFQRSRFEGGGYLSHSQQHPGK